MQESTGIFFGRARDVFAALDKPLVLKMQFIGPGIRDRNKQEWDTHVSSSSIRDIVPQVYGYAKQAAGSK